MFKKIFTVGTSLLLTVTLLTQMACGASNFATDLRLALAVSTPFIESLNLGGRRAAIIADFTELGTDAATMADSINVCAGNKLCELNSVQTFETSFETVANRDFNNIPKLQTVESLVRGIINAAKVYYSPPALRAARRSSTNQAKLIKDKIEELKKFTHGG